MVYSDRFVLCILVDNKPLKELANGTVPIKFGTEYSIRLRNKNNRRAVAKITIDGEEVSGGGFVVPANDYVDIKRHATKDVAFKFVSLNSEEAVDFGKNGPNDDKVKGTIQVSFFLEREAPIVKEVKEVHHWHYPKYIKPWHGPYWGSGIVYGSSTIGSSSIHNSSLRSCSNNLSGSIGSFAPTNMPTESNTVSIDANNTQNVDALQDGCTVEGEATGQNFNLTFIDTESQSITLTLFLQGYMQQTHKRTRQKVNKIKPAEDLEKTLEELEIENAKLRKQLALIENENLKKAIKNKNRRKKVISE